MKWIDRFSHSSPFPMQLPTANSYVKFDLEQDNMVLDKQYGTQKSTTKQNDTSPEYQETFWFEIPVSKILC